VPTWKARATSGAADPALPACEAVIVHTPAATAVTIVLETVHTSGVSERNETRSPDGAVACSLTEAPTAVAGTLADVPSGWPKTMVCRPAPTAAPVSHARSARGV
jgi:hypothetical protein